MAPAPAARRWPTVLVGLVAGAVLIITVAGAGFTEVKRQLGDNITSLDVSEQTGVDLQVDEFLVVDEQTGATAPFTMVVMGSDSRTGKGNKGYGKASKFGDVERSDTTIILHVNADRSKAIGVSIPRDTLMTLPECTKDGQTVGGYEGRFNEAMVLGGPGCVLKAIEKLSGLQIDNFMVIDFGAFKRITEAVGGVEICLEEDINDPLSGLDLPAGLHTVSGEEALAYVRARKTLGDGSDTSRIRRQQAFLSSMARKVLSSDILLNPASLLNILNATTESLTADPQLADIDNLQQLALSMKDLRPQDITFTTMPWKNTGDGATVQVATKRADPLWEAIATDGTWPPKGGSDQPLLKVAPENIRVEVINLTGVKGAGKQAKRALTSQGFTVVNVKKVKPDNADEYPTVDTVRFDPRWDVSAKTLVYSTGIEATEEVEGQGATMQVVITQPLTSANEVVVSEETQDLTANVNTGDENFCAT